MVCLSSPLFPVTASVLLSDMASATPHHMAKSILSVAAALKYNWSHMRYTWTLQPHPIYGAFLWVLFEFSHSISGNAFIVSRRCTNHHTTNVQSFKRSVTWTYCVLKDWKHYSHFMGSLRYIWKVDTKLHRKGKKNKFQWVLTHLVDGWRKGRKLCS